MEQRTTAPAGWYPHPSMAATQRYWDGERWTDHIAPGAPQTAKPVVTPKPDVPDWLYGVGYAAAIFLPIIGLIIGVVLLAKGKTDHGVGMIVLAVVVMALLLGGGLL